MALHHYVPQDRLRALGRGAELPERAQGAALFADISGFTTLTETLRRSEGERRGIESLSQRVNAVYDVLIGAVESQGGSVIGFAGDAITCWFDDADGPASLRAAWAARSMQAAMPRFPDLAVKVAVGSGPARRFTVGHPDIQRIDALAGATLHRVAAGEGLALPGEVLLDEATALALNLAAAPARIGPAGEGFVVLDPEVALPSPAEAAAADPVPLLPDAETLRPWLLPFVFDRETAGQSHFVTDLRPATAVFIRIGGLDYDHDEAAAAALADVVARSQRSMRRHGGVLLELTIGDKGSYLYGSFGAAQVHEDDAARALRAALAVRDALVGTALTLQGGVSSGTMRVGGYGGRTRQSFGAIGDDVNTAARLMGLARPGELLISGRVRQAVGDEFALEARSPIPMKGKAEPMPVFAVLRAQQRRAIRLQEPASSTPMVGREDETAVLADAVAAALQGRGQLVGLTADAGMGKSRLVAEGVRLARASGFIGYGGACRMDGIRTPYLVWQTIWTAFFDLDPALPLRRQIRQVESELQHHIPQHAEAWPLLGAELSLDWPANDFTRALQPRDRKALLESLLVQCLVSSAAEAAADGIGVLLVLEDLHAADPLSLDLLLQVARAIEALPVLVLLSFRPDDAQPAQGPAALLQDLPHYRQIELGPLDGRQVEQVIRAKLATLFPERSGAVPAALIGLITERAQGNPFYVEELLNYLHDRGIDPRHAAAAASLELPSSLYSLVLSRTDRLPVQQQQTLKAASVIGRLFRDADLLDYYPELGPPDQVQAGLRELDRLGLTPQAPAEPEASHLFKHRVTHEVAYESIAYAARAELHGRYAEHLKARHAGHLGPLATQLAHHYLRAALVDEAAVFLRQAGEQAAARYANDEALEHFEQALLCLPPQAAEPRFELLLQREAILALQGRHDLRRGQLDELDRLAPALPDPDDAQAQVAVRRAQMGIDTGNPAGARVWAQSAIAALERHGTLAGSRAERLVDALRVEARALFFAGDAAAARPPLDRALTLAREQGYPRGEIDTLSMLGLLHWHTGDLDAADERLGQSLRTLGDTGDARRQLDILNNLGVVAKARSRHAQAVAHYETAQAIAQRIGDRSGQAMLLNNMGDVYLELGDFHRAGVVTEQSARIFQEVHEPVSRGSALINRAEAHRGLGQYDAARDLSLQALALLRAGQHRRGEAVVLDNLGLVAFGQGRFDDAIAQGREALALAREIGWPALEAGILRNLGRAHTAAAQHAAAAQALEQAAVRAQEVAAEPLALEVQVAQAEAQLARSGAAAAPQAVVQLSPALPLLLDASAQAAAGLPMWVPLVAWRALAAAQDARADAVLAAARHELQRRSARIPDARSRRDFLAVAEHQALAAPPAPVA